MDKEESSRSMSCFVANLPILPVLKVTVDRFQESHNCTQIKTSDADKRQEGIMNAYSYRFRLTSASNNFPRKLVTSRDPQQKLSYRHFQLIVCVP